MLNCRAKFGITLLAILRLSDSSSSADCFARFRGKETGRFARFPRDGFIRSLGGYRRIP